MDRYGPKNVKLTLIHQQTISAATVCISLECMNIADTDMFTISVFATTRKAKAVGLRRI